MTKKILLSLLASEELYSDEESSDSNEDIGYILKKESGHFMKNKLIFQHIINLSCSHLKCKRINKINLHQTNKSLWYCDLRKQ